MREIKFRAWIMPDHNFDIGEESYMYQWSWDFFSEDSPVTKYTKAFPGSFGLSDVILMQYTGSNDVTGEEIYEGDILNIIFDDSIAPVVWEGNGFWIKQNRFGGNSWFPVPEACRIIGNIYENPELLSK